MEFFVILYDALSEKDTPRPCPPYPYSPWATCIGDSGILESSITHGLVNISPAKSRAARAARSLLAQLNVGRPSGLLTLPYGCSRLLITLLVFDFSKVLIWWRGGQLLQVLITCQF